MKELEVPGQRDPKYFTKQARFDTLTNAARSEEIPVLAEISENYDNLKKFSMMQSIMLLICQDCFREKKRLKKKRDGKNVLDLRAEFEKAHKSDQPRDTVIYMLRHSVTKGVFHVGQTNSVDLFETGKFKCPGKGYEYETNKYGHLRKHCKSHPCNQSKKKCKKGFERDQNSLTTNYGDI
uniref:C2H2-type domain-containing protein n=1 Tax=Rhabditophanes sp. KR3021 TaxID=114890 RepID=A0AC35TJW3_9BILA